MKAVQLMGHGGLEQLKWRDDVPLPRVGRRELLVQVGASAVNNTDLNTRLGWYSKGERGAKTGWLDSPFVFPRIQGADTCGHVVAVGSEVDSQRLGQRVLIEPCLFEVAGKRLDRPWYFGSECDGAFAEYAVVAASHAHPVHSELSDVELASFPCSYSTAENLLTRSGVQAGERVLVTGASGGVGSAVLQLAKARGAELIAVSSPSKAGALMELGADQCLDRDGDCLPDLGAGSVEVVIDLVAGPRWPCLLDLLKPFGRYACSGAVAGHDVDLDLRTLYLKDLTLYGCTVLGEGVFSSLVRRIEAAEVKPLLSKVFALDELLEAQRVFAMREHIGKIAIDVAGRHV